MTPPPRPSDTHLSPGIPGAELFLISMLILYLELACIRWFPAHVLYLTFFSNAVLLAAFLGMSLGCLLAGRRRNYVETTAPLLFVAMLAGLLIGVERDALQSVLRVGDPNAPQLVFFGTEYAADDPTRFVIPIEFLAGFFFLAVALVMVGPGQELGRAFNRMPDRLRAYSLNIAGSLTGILLFALGSFLELSPVWWFVPVALALTYFVFGASTVRDRPERWRMLVWVVPCLMGVLVIASNTSGTVIENGKQIGTHFWSPYYRVDYVSQKAISVNLIGHQTMVSRDAQQNPGHAYALPYLLSRDSGQPAFGDVLIIGAGSGNDVSRALAFGARSVDAVEIDPVIQRIGAADHPDKPYQDPRVTVHIGDGRNFLRVSKKQYDLIVFALVDSLVLHSGYSNLRLESFMFTQEAFADVRARLKPGGTLLMYNFFRQGWIVDRLSHGLRGTFGADPLIVTLPFLEEISPETRGGFTILMSGATDPIAQAFNQKGEYWLAAGEPPSLATPNGFDIQVPEAERDRWLRFAPSRLVSRENLRDATDDWPFLYLRGPMIPGVSARGIAMMGGIAIVLFAAFVRTAPKEDRLWRMNPRMFFLGAAFMLVETKAVVHMALLFGSTWIVNTIVFAGILVMILAANLFVWKIRPKSLTPYYAFLMIAVAINWLVPLDALLGFSRTWQIVGACMLSFTPVLFAGVIFAVCFNKSVHPDRDFSANVAGAMVGGLAENTSMLLGFQHLTLVIAAFYVLSAWTFGRSESPRD